MKDFASLIKERRSTRKFTSQLLNPDQVADGSGFKKEKSVAVCCRGR